MAPSRPTARPAAASQTSPGEPLRALREGTRSWHAHIETLVPVFDSAFTIHHYRRLLERFYGYYAAFEPAVQAAVPLEQLLPDWPERRKLPALLLDLRSLGLRENDIRALPVATRLPSFHSPATCDLSGRPVYHNRQFFSYGGLSNQELALNGWDAILHPDDRKSYRAAWAGALAAGGPYDAEIRLRRHSDGEYRWHLIRALPFPNGSGQIVKWVGTCTDIHARKTETERLELQVAIRTSQLERLLQQKDVLLQEVHHRVRNNLQVISSLLEAQRATLTGPESAALLECQHRVLTMGLIYGRLSSDDPIGEIDFAEYARTLLAEIAGSYKCDDFTVEADAAIILNVDQAIPCGLILNELASNSMKQAALRPAGPVRIAVDELPTGIVRLTVSDPGNADKDDQRSLALTIVKCLTDQLDGTLTHSFDKGTKITLEFPHQIASTQARSAAG